MLTEDNKLLLKQTLYKIETEPESWSQISWGYRTACRTAACFAGHAVMLHDPTELPPEGDVDAGNDWLVGGKPVREVARTLLGLTNEQAEELFWSNNELVELQRGVQALLDTDGQIDAEDLSRRMGGPEDAALETSGEA